MTLQRVCVNAVKSKQHHEVTIEYNFSVTFNLNVLFYVDHLQQYAKVSHFIICAKMNA